MQRSKRRPRVVNEHRRAGRECCDGITSRPSGTNTALTVVGQSGVHGVAIDLQSRETVA